MRIVKWFETSENSYWNEREYTSSKSFNSSLSIGEVSNKTVDGFGGCFNELGQIALTKLSEHKRKEVLDMLFSTEGEGLRLNFCRLPIGASDYAEKWYSHNETEGDYDMKYFSIERDKVFLLPYIKEALKRNPEIMLFASPWSPPTWMKHPQVYNYGNLIMDDRTLNAYALYFAKFIKAYKNEGVTVNQLHVQNEPVSSQKFPSCVWSGEQFAKFIGEYLGPVFESSGIDTEIWLGTINAPELDERMLYTRYNDYANLVLHDSEAYKYIKGVSYQWAGKFAVAQTHESWPEMRLMQSESECGDGSNTWVYARYINEMMRHYFTAGVNSYIYWNMMLEPSGESTWGWKQNALITIEPESGKVIFNPEYYVMKHYSRYVQKNAKQFSLSGHWAGTSLAFENPDDSVILITTNPFKRDMNVKIYVKGEEYILNLKADTINTVVIKRG